MANADMKSPNENQLPLVRELFAAKENMDQAKERYDAARKAVQEAMVDDSVPGTTHFRLSDTMKMTVSVGRTIDVDKNAFRDQYAAMRNRGLIGDNSVIQMKPSVSVTAFKYLSDEDKAQFGHVFRMKTSAPQIKFDLIKDD